MCVKFLLGNMNPDPYPPHPTYTYTCGITLVLRVCGEETLFNIYNTKGRDFISARAV